MRLIYGQKAGRRKKVHDLDLIRERVDLHDLAEEAGAEFRGDSSRCPLHGGDNPTAFHVYENGRKWHCFTNCTDGENDGDVFSFYMRWKGVEFKEAVKEFLDRLPGTRLTHCGFR